MTPVIIPLAHLKLIFGVLDVLPLVVVSPCLALLRSLQARLFEWSANANRYVRNSFVTELPLGFGEIKKNKTLRKQKNTYIEYLINYCIYSSSYSIVDTLLYDTQCNITLKNITKYQLVIKCIHSKLTT